MERREAGMLTVAQRGCCAGEPNWVAEK